MYDSERAAVYTRLLDYKKYEELLELIKLDYQEAKGGMTWWSRLQCRRQTAVVRVGVRMLRSMDSDTS